MNGELGILRRPVRPICSGTPRCFTRCADAMPNCGSGTGGVYVVAAGDGFPDDTSLPRLFIYAPTTRRLLLSPGVGHTGAHRRICCPILCSAVVGCSAVIVSWCAVVVVVNLTSATPPKGKRLGTFLLRVVVVNLALG